MDKYNLSTASTITVLPKNGWGWSTTHSMDVVYSGSFAKVTLCNDAETTTLIATAVPKDRCGYCGRLREVGKVTCMGCGAPL